MENPPLLSELDLLKERGEIYQAILLAEEALPNLPPDGEIYSPLLHQLVSYYLQVQDVEKAEARAQKLLMRAKKNNHIPDLLLSYLALSNVCYYQSRRSEALGYLERAKELALLLENYESLCQVLYNQAADCALALHRQDNHFPAFIREGFQWAHRCPTPRFIFLFDHLLTYAIFPYHFGVLPHFLRRWKKDFPSFSPSDQVRAEEDGLARLCLKLARPRFARRAYTHLLQKTQRHALLQHQIIAEFKLLELSFEEGKIEEVVAGCRRILEVSRGRPHVRIASGVKNLLTRALYLQGNSSEAFSLLAPEAMGTPFSLPLDLLYIFLESGHYGKFFPSLLEEWEQAKKREPSNQNLMDFWPGLQAGVPHDSPPFGLAIDEVERLLLLVRTFLEIGALREAEAVLQLSKTHLHHIHARTSFAYLLWARLQAKLQGHQGGGPEADKTLSRLTSFLERQGLLLWALETALDHFDILIQGNLLENIPSLWGHLSLLLDQVPSPPLLARAEYLQARYLMTLGEKIPAPSPLDPNTYELRDSLKKGLDLVQGTGQQDLSWRLYALQGRLLFREGKARESAMWLMHALAEVDRLEEELPPLYAKTHRTQSEVRMLLDTVAQITKQELPQKNLDQSLASSYCPQSPQRPKASTPISFQAFSTFEKQGTSPLSLTLPDFVGFGKHYERVVDFIDRVRRIDFPVLLLGETGTGKDRVARLIHQQSRFAQGPFIPINCAAIPETLLESELFGFKRGAFTGAVQEKKGRFLLAHGGTLFLDEIGDLSLPLQGKLLQVLEEKKVLPLGALDPVPFSCRLISATLKDVAQGVQEGWFREDLLYRLNILVLRLPALRERPEDIPLLVSYFLDRACREGNLPPKEMSEKALIPFFHYPWPGNIRELENTVKTMAALCPEPVISHEFALDFFHMNKNHALSDVPSPGPSSSPFPQRGIGHEKEKRPADPFKKNIEPLFCSLRERLAELTRQELVRALEHTRDNVTEAARLLHISRPYFYQLLREHGLAGHRKRL